MNLETQFIDDILWVYQLKNLEKYTENRTK